MLGERFHCAAGAKPSLSRCSMEALLIRRQLPRCSQRKEILSGIRVCYCTLGQKARLLPKIVGSNRGELPALIVKLVMICPKVQYQHEPRVCDIDLAGSGNATLGIVSALKN
jgi:hypothetical protein